MKTAAKRAVNLVAISLPGFNLRSDIAPIRDRFVEDVVRLAITMTSECVVRIPDAPGLEFEVSAEFIDAYRVL